MLYVIAGKSETYHKYLKEQKLKNKIHAVNVRTQETFYSITEDDTLILLHGWWGRSWAKEALKDLQFNLPKVAIIYNDGKFGESERKSLKRDKIHDRFEILDFRKD